MLMTSPARERFEWDIGIFDRHEAPDPRFPLPGLKAAQTREPWALSPH
jgi:hypothetical protein